MADKLIFTKTQIRFEIVRDQSQPVAVPPIPGGKKKAKAAYRRAARQLKSILHRGLIE